MSQLLNNIRNKRFVTYLKKYPSSFWDYLISSGLFLSLFLVFVYLLMNNNTITDIVIYQIIWHSIIVLPILFVTGSLRQWDMMYTSLRSPLLFKSVAILYFYLLVYGLYITIIRYTRLGNEINLHLINEYLINNISYVVLIVLIWPYISIWLRLFIWTFLDIKEYLWLDVINLIFLVHIKLLRYTWYFNLTETLYKLSYIWISFIIHDPHVYIKYPRSIPRKCLNYFYRYPVILTIIVCSLCFLEACVNKGKVYYGVYLLVLYLALTPIAKAINALAFSEWARNCCIADYINGRWSNPRYFEKFWLAFEGIRIEFNYSPEIPSDVLEQINETVKQLRLKSYHRSNNFSSKSTFKERIKYGYHDWSQVRWMHTEAIALTIWHPMVTLFARKTTDYVVAINNHWSHYHSIERFNSQLHRQFLYREIEYKNFVTPDYKILSKATEHNLQTNFTELLHRGVGLFKYDANIRTNTHNQSQDDIIIDPRNAKPPVQDRRVHALDQKASANVNLSPDSLNNISTALNNLYKTADNLHDHQLVWLENLHLFPDKYIPPMRVPYNFSINDMKPHILDQLKESNIYMQRKSNLLYANKIRCDYKNATDIFNDSEIQKLFKEN